MLLINADRSKSDRWFDCSVRVRNVGFTIDDVADDFIILFNKKGEGFDMILTFPKLMSAKVLICSFLDQIPETLTNEYFYILEIFLSLLSDFHCWCV